MPARGSLEANFGNGIECGVGVYGCKQQNNYAG